MRLFRFVAGRKNPVFNWASGRGSALLDLCYKRNTSCATLAHATWGTLGRVRAGRFSPSCFSTSSHVTHPTLQTAPIWSCSFISFTMVSSKGSAMLTPHTLKIELLSQCHGFVEVRVYETVINTWPGSCRRPSSGDLALATASTALPNDLKLFRHLRKHT